MLLDPGQIRSPTAAPRARRPARSRGATSPRATRPVPSTGHGHVERPSLVERLLRSAAPLALVVAPAGYGKTMLLREWAGHDERPFAWVTAVDADNDPAHLLGSIVRGLHAAGALPPGLVHELGGPRADQLAAGKDHVLAVLAAALHPAVLVLDAVEVLQAPDALGLVAAVVEHVGPGSTVAIASRAEPAFAIGRLRARTAWWSSGSEICS
jgi:LuxR family maltose regulon positive regulatory protein